MKVYYTTPGTSGDPVIQKIRYFYNADGQKICTIDNDGSLTHYIYDGPQSIAELDNTGKVNTQFIHGGGLAGDVGSLVYKEQLDSSQPDGVDTSYFFYNYRGDVIDVTTEYRKISYRYDAFGNVIHLSGDQVENSFLFSSKRFNEAIGLSYFEARYYDAFIGRFISRDPMGFIDGPNQYFYCMNNPLGYIDPFGLNKRGLQWAWENVCDLAVSPARATYNHFFEEYKLIDDLQTIPKEGPLNIYATGNWTDDLKAKAEGEALNSHYVLHDPTSGFFTDFFGSVLDSTLGRVIPSRKSFQYADFIENDMKGRVLNIAVFSQSAITVTAGNEILAMPGREFKFQPGSKMIYMGSGAPDNRINKAGFNVGLIPEKNLFIHNHPEDPIPAIAHFNIVNTIKYWGNIFPDIKNDKPAIHSIVGSYADRTKSRLPDEVWW